MVNQLAMFSKSNLQEQLSCLPVRSSLWVDNEAIQEYYINHKDIENTCCRNKGSGEVFVTYFSSIESNVILMEADGYKGQVEKKLVGCTLNKSAVSVKMQNGN